MTGKTSAEAVRYLRREERKTKIKIMLEHDPDRRADLEAREQRLKERREAVASIARKKGRAEKATLEQ